MTTTICERSNSNFHYVCKRYFYVVTTKSPEDLNKQIDSVTVNMTNLSNNNRIQLSTDKTSAIQFRKRRKLIWRNKYNLCKLVKISSGLHIDEKFVMNTSSCFLCARGQTS